MLGDMIGSGWLFSMRLGPHKESCLDKASSLIPYGPSYVFDRLETPLKGGENPIMEEGTGFDSHVPRSSKAQTPNVLASGKRQGMESGGATPGSATPMSVRSGSASTLRSSHPGNATPMRDQLGLNKPERDEYQLMVLNEKKRLKQQKAMLLTGLEGLPAPQYMYDIEVPTEVREARIVVPSIHPGCSQALCAHGSTCFCLSVCRSVVCFRRWILRKLRRK